MWQGMMEVKGDLGSIATVCIFPSIYKYDQNLYIPI